MPNAAIEDPVFGVYLIQMAAYLLNLLKGKIRTTDFAELVRFKGRLEDIF